MSKGAYDIFALVINFLGTDWQPKHITIGLFEAMDTLVKLWLRILLSCFKYIIWERELLLM
jgi:hypothetical protein